jgi:arginine decarboxylase
LALGIRRVQIRAAAAPRIEVTGLVDARIRRLIPFKLTAGQEQSIDDISQDLRSDQPIHRLNEIPTERGVLCDITCDSDGAVDKFVDLKEVKESLEMHPLRDGEPYYLAILLLGAYQETLGDLHNLFGIVTEANVIVTNDGRMLIDRLIKGDTVREVVEDTGYDSDELRGSVARQLAQRRSQGLISEQDEQQMLETVASVLNDYTYLK